VNTQHSLTSRVLAVPSSPLPFRPWVSAAMTGTPVPSTQMYSMSGSVPAGAIGMTWRAVIAAASASMTRAAAWPSASARRRARSPVSVIPASSPASAAAAANGRAAAARSVILASPGDMVSPATPSSASRGANPCPHAVQ
jgi:hypothetical protein